MIDLGPFLAKLTTNAGANSSSIARLRREARGQLPEDYVEFMKSTNGAEGFLGNVAYLIVWPVEQLDELNKAYGFAESGKRWFLFGSNGGDAGYVFDFDLPRAEIVEVPFIDMSPVRSFGSTFEGFLRALSRDRNSG